MKIKMAKTNSFTIIPEGEHIFKIDAVTYDETFGKMEVKLVTKDGGMHTERYNLLTDSGETNEGALVAFSYLAKTALNNFEMEDCEPNDLVGHFFKATVEHQQVVSKKDPNKTLTFVKLNDKTYATGFDGEEAAELDLDSLLG